MQGFIGHGCIENVTVDDCLAWLEKQGSKKSVDDLTQQEAMDIAVAKCFEQGEQKEINLVKILKHCPKETKLYSPLYGKLWLAEVDEKNGIIICYKHHLEEGCTRAVLEQEDTVSFYSNGTTGLPDFNVSKDCMLFLYDTPKEVICTREAEVGNGNIKALVTEKIPTDKIEPKFHEGDWIISNDKKSTYQVIEVKRGIYVIRDNANNHEFHIDIEACERSGRLWNISDAKPGDVLVNDFYFIFIFKEISDGKHAWETAKCCYPATKKQRDLLFKKNK